MRRARSSATARSVTTISASRPIARTSSATDSRRSSLRAASTTVAPSRAKPSAIERPRPGPIPETMAIRRVTESCVTECSGVVATAVLEPLRQLDRWVRQRRDAAVGKKLVEPVAVGFPRAGIAHHHFVELDAFGPGRERAERRPQWQIDVRAGGAPTIAAREPATQYVDDLMAVVAVPMHDHARIPPRV